MHALAQGKKDSVTLALVLEPPGLDPTAGAASSIAEVTLYNIYETLTKINPDGSVSPLLAESWGGLARPQDLHLPAAQGRHVPERRALRRRGRQVLVRPSGRRQEHQQGQAHLRQPLHPGG
ncbi:ABC-type transporter, periplasmic subunit [Alicycliphilus sp. B1]|nr:ABC-type transporter, periplasmic subunit [Alicycliphilus sp. B1]